MKATDNEALRKSIIDVVSILGWSMTELHSVMAANNPSGSKQCEGAINKARALVESAQQRLQTVTQLH